MGYANSSGLVAGMLRMWLKVHGRRVCTKGVPSVIQKMDTVSSAGQKSVYRKNKRLRTTSNRCVGVLCRTADPRYIGRGDKWSCGDIVFDLVRSEIM